MKSLIPIRRTLCAIVLVAAACLSNRCACAQETLPPKPTMANVPYGKHVRMRLDFYKAQADRPTPLLFFIHEGGWMGGDKGAPSLLIPCLKSGISVVSINYRLIPDAVADAVTPPVKACLGDSARALQFVRSKAAEWNIDRQRIAGCGISAGGFTALWLAFHPDLADPKSADPVARQSTRLRCAVALAAQTSLDPRQMTEWTPNNDYGGHAFSLASYQEFMARRDKLMPWIQDFSPYALLTPDDPPVYLYYDIAPSLGHASVNATHSANFGVGLAAKLKSLGVEFELSYPGATGLTHPDMFGFLLAKLRPDR
jgi:acetyl esterase/lipase